MSDLASPIAGGVLLSPFALVGYGFYDAYATVRIDPSVIDVRVEPVSWNRLYFDSMRAYADRSDDGDIFLKVTWRPGPGKRVAQIRVSGSAYLDGREIDQFAGLCQRRGDTTLRPWPEEARSDTACFFRLETPLPNRKGSNGRAVDSAERERVNAEVEAIDLRNLQARVSVSNAPMKFISWLEEKYRAVRSLVVSPFERAA